MADKKPFNGEYCINPFPYYTENADSSEYSAWGKSPIYNKTVDDQGENLDEKAKLTGNPKGFGRMYTKYIYARTPMMYLQAGRPKMFGNPLKAWGMTDGEQAVKQAIITAMNEDSPDELDTAAGELNEIFGGKDGNPSRFYSFFPTWELYQATSNELARQLANLVGVSSSEIDKYSLENEKYGNHPSSYWARHLAGLEDRLMVRIERSSSMSDGFDNETGQSELESRLDSMTSMAKEVRFLLGENDVNSAEGAEVASSLGNILGTGVEAVGHMLNGAIKTMDESLPLSKTINGAGNILFPHIYKDSLYNPSYNIQMQFIAANGSPTCLARNIIIPVSQMLPFILPVQTGVNTYASPFMMKMTAPGWFSGGLCMVTSASLERGDLSAYSYAHSMPTVINLNLTVKDMYPTMMMTLLGSKNSAKDFFKMYYKNTQFSQFLMNLAGIPILEDENIVMDMYNIIEKIKGKVYNLGKASTYAGIMGDVFKSDFTKGIGKAYQTLMSLEGRSNQ